MTSDRRQALAALADELQELARHAPARLGERLAELSIREQAELALRLPARLRLELLLHAPRPMRLVRSLPESEFYLTLRELGPADALPMVALASAEQLQHLVDLESWHLDRFDAELSGAWLALLLDAGEPAARRLLRAADDEQLALWFQRWFRAQPIEPEDGADKHGHGLTEAGDELGLVSPDGHYRFSPAVKEHASAMQRLAQLLFLDQPERYRRALWAALYELPAELEELALRWRTSRLEERGFPPWDEALDVYAPPTGSSEHPRPPEPVDPDGPACPLAPRRLDAERDRLGAVLDRLTDDGRERALYELLALANRLLVADRGETGDPSAHRAALGTAAGYIWIALEARGAADPLRGSEIVAERPLIELFREGFARAVELQRRARTLVARGWPTTHARALDLLDEPLGERLAALLEPRPLYVEIPAPEGAPTRRPFRSSAELEETRAAVEMAEVVGRLLVERLGLDVAAAVDDPAVPARLSTCFLTLLAWHAARGELRGSALPADVVADFLRTVASRRTADPGAPARTLDGFLARLRDELDLGPRESGVLAAFGRACLERLVTECGSLDPGVPVDARGVSCLLLAPRGL
jgi:hypothetical protein